MQYSSILKILVASIFALFSLQSFAEGDALKKAIKVAEHGSKFQAQRLKVIAENLANEHTTSTTPGGDPYRRKRIHAKNNYDKKHATRLIKVKKYSEDTKTPFDLRYDPNHPAADLNGYVKYPNVSKEIERADSLEAERSYSANLSVIETVKSMQTKTLEILR